MPDVVKPGETGEPGEGEHWIALVERARRGDRDAFGRLVERYRPAVVGTARALLANHHDAEEVAQEALVQAWRELPNLRDPSRFPAWLSRITRTRCSNFRARWRQDTLPLDGLDWPAEHTSGASGSGAAWAVHEAIGALSDANRLTTSLFYLDGYSIEEIAALLDVPKGTVKRRLHDARVRLKDRMAGFAGLRRSQNLRQPGRALPPAAVSPPTVSTARTGKEHYTVDATSHQQSGTDLTVPAGSLEAALRRVTLAAAQDDRRPTLQNVLFRWTPEGLTLAAADGFRVANVTLPDVPEPAPGTAAAVPQSVLLAARTAKALGQVLAGLPDTDLTRFVVSSDGRRVSITAGDVTLLSPLEEGTYPPVVPIPEAWHAWRTRVTLETTALRDALHEAARAGHHGPLLLDVAPAWLRFYVQDAGTAGAPAPAPAESMLPAILEGVPQRVALNRTYLLQTLDAATGAQVQLSWGDPLKPMIVREVRAAETDPPDEPRLVATWAVMPMKAPSVMDHAFAAA
jgi:RNA polymerase sigma-70 factor (ECF subfamily)